MKQGVGAAAGTLLSLVKPSARLNATLSYILIAAEQGGTSPYGSCRHYKRERPVIAWLIRFALIYWLVSVVFRWLSGGGQKQKKSARETTSGEDRSQATVSGVPYDSDIEDAEFEEIDDREA